jgi:hypothetical protein
MLDLQEDYPELEGKVVTYFNQDDPNYPPFECKVRVVGCNRAIGLTLVKDDEPNVFATCLSAKKAIELNKYANYQYIFNHYVRGIIAGYIDSTDSVIYPDGNVQLSSGNPRAETCPFGQ